MNRTFTRRHKPKRSDQTLDSQDSRCDDSKECSDESSDDDDDDEDEDEDRSTDQDTEESEDPSMGKRRELEVLAKYLRNQKAYLERNPPDSFHRMPGAKKETKDKMTQKNLTSPMPSMWKPPVYKEISAAPNFRVIKSREVKDKESEFEDIMLRYITKLQGTNDAYRNDCGRKPCPHKPTAAERIKKLCSKHKKQVEHRPKRGRHEDVHTCIEKGLCNMGGHIRQPERVKNESRNLRNHSRCGMPVRCRQNSQIKESGETAKVKEKLVYVVEEEGKGVAKMETDLFSVNEILAIKQDLLELSEFAKKLKRLKEMKSESEREKSSGTECQCKPLTELLRGVNKRMEALEARQEELERGIQKTREMETDTKKTDDTKTLSVPPPLGPVKPEPSAVKSVSSFGKSEMSREGGGVFSKNLEIVNELLDIKSQLQRLERKRMSKELSPEIGPAGSSKTKSKDQAINVFSSKTYILTTDAYNKKKTNKENLTEEKSPNSAPSMKGETAAGLEGQPVNDIVTDWLKNISAPENPNSNLKVYGAPNNLVRNESKREDSWRTSFLKEKNCGRVLEGEDFGNQEPQKNRAKDTGRRETSQHDPKCSREIPTNQNRTVPEDLSWRNKPKGRINRDNIKEKFPTEVFSRGSKRTFTKPLKIASSSSVPSVFAVKEQIQRQKHLGKFSKEAVPVKPCRSKSAQEFTSASHLSKDEKMVLNMSRKNMEAKCARKRDKENENEYVQGELNKFLKQRKGIVPIFSELVASVNLDEGSTSLRNDRSRNADCPLPLFPFPLLSPEILKILEYCEEEEKKDDRENWCRRENWEHKPKHNDKENDKTKACVKSCCRKKRRVKCSRNHCCNKKAKRAASRSSSACCHKDSNASCHSHHRRKKKENKKYYSESCKHSKKRHKARRTCSNGSLSPIERKVKEECKPKEKPCYGKTGKCKQPCVAEYGQGHSSCETSKTEESKCQRREEPRSSRTSEQCEEQMTGKPQKSSLKSRKYCRSARLGRGLYDDDSCYITNFWKNLRKFYPRFSALQLMSWLRLYCQEENKTKQKFQKKQNEETAGCKPPREKQKKHECPNCQCCKSVYRMSTFHQNWPGVTPSSKISEDSITEAETRSSNTTTETDFMFPYRKSERFHAFKATTEDDHEEPKKKKKSKSRKKKKNATDSEELVTEGKKCQCERCGNVHKKKEREVKYDKSTSKPESEAGSGQTKKPKRSILSRLQDVRHLRVCEGKIKCPKLKFSKTKSDCGCLGSESKRSHGVRGGNSKKGDKYCHCKSKLQELEDRINHLEEGKKKKHKKHEPEECTDPEHCEKKKKKKKKKKEQGSDNSGEKSGDKKICTTPGCHCEEEVEKKKKKEKKKEREDEHHKCPCYHEGKKKKKKSKKSHSSADGQEVETHYCKCLSKGLKTDQQSLEQTAATTAAPTVTPTVTPTPSAKSSFRQNLQKKKKELLEKLSSLSTYWKNLRTRRKSEYEDDLVDDPSRSSAVPYKRSIHPVNDEPSLIKKLRKTKKQKKDKAKKEKHKERRAQKSKSRRRRHKLG